MMNYGKIVLVITCCLCAASAQQGNAVQNFKCVLYDWEDYMRCSWTLADKNVDNVSVRYSVNKGHVRNCNFLSQDKSSCKICGETCQSLPVTLSPLSVLKWHFNVTVGSSKQSFELRPIDHVKPAPVESLKIEEIADPECVRLSWKHNLNGETIVHIKYVMEWDKNIAKVVNTTNDQVEICGLVPYTIYTFDVSASPERGGYFSDNVTQHYRTPESVPAAAPPIAVGSFERETNTCINKNSFHNVTVYWKEMPKRFQYGEIVGYNLNIVHHGNVSVGNVLQSRIALKCDTPYEVEIRARTREGVSPYTSSILIPRATNKAWSPPEVLIILDRNQTQYMYNISWTDTAVPEYQDYNYTIHYCNKSVLSCKTELQSITMTSADKFFVFQRSHSVHLRVGVSVDHGLQSSGVLFTSCFYNKTGVPATPNHKDIVVTPDPDNSLTVTWTKSSKCDGVLPYVTSYRVWWCEVQLGRQCKGNESSKDVMAKRFTRFEYVITDLKKETLYGIRLQALSAYRESSKSVMKLATPKNNDIPAYLIVIIVIVSVGVVFLASLGLYSCWRCCGNSRRDLKALNEVDFPNIEHRRLEPESSQNSTLLPVHRHVTNMASDRDLLLPKVKNKKNKEEKVSLDSGRGSLPTQDPENGLEGNQFADGQVLSQPTVQRRKRKLNDELPEIVRDDSSSCEDIRQPGHYSMFAAVDDSSGEPIEPKHSPGNYAVCDTSSGTHQHCLTENFETFQQNGSSEIIATSDNSETDEISNQSTAVQTLGTSMSNNPPTTVLPSVKRLACNDPCSVKPGKDPGTFHEDQEDSVWVQRKLDETDDSADIVVSPSSQSSASTVSTGGKVCANKGSNSLPDYVKESLTCSSDDTAEISKISENSFINPNKKDFSVRFSDLKEDQDSKKKKLILSDKNITL